ncbi:MAG TPA: DUF2267 domain-containing protein [Caulobacteraceae bacterium]|jgi:uncharacterized protein (DUF2267 family)
MSTLPVFDTTLRETNTWLKQVETTLESCDRHQSYVATRAVLHVLRDRLPVEAVLALSAQLPMLMRGFFLEGWRPVDGPTHIRHAQDFAGAVAASLPPSYPHDPARTVEVVFAMLADRVDPGETSKLIRHLPPPLRVLWPADYRID